MRILLKAHSELLKYSRNLRKSFTRCRNLLSKQEILVIGDSHAEVFNNKLFRDNFKNHFFNTVIVPGATVSGLENPNSKTQALPIFKKAIKSTGAKTIITLLGEVDAGFVIWYRAEKYKVPVSAMLHQAINNYQELLKSISKDHRVICISAPYPTIKDGQTWGDVANLRKDVKATYADRVELTTKFNMAMREFCTKYDIAYLSLDGESLDSKGHLKTALLNTNPFDHHYDTDAYSKIIVNKLRFSALI